MTDQALILTQAEWDDLENVCQQFVASTANLVRHDPPAPRMLAAVNRRRNLCRRIIEANQ